MSSTDVSSETTTQLFLTASVATRVRSSRSNADAT